MVSLYNTGNSIIQACLECDGNLEIEVSCNVDPPLIHGLSTFFLSFENLSISLAFAIQT